MIESFADKDTAAVFAEEPCRKLPADIHERAREVMLILDSAVRIEALWPLRGLRAKKLTQKGRPHLWSLRINDQWRLTFDWDAETGSAHHVRICDYH